MAKRPLYPEHIERKYQELPSDHPRRTTDTKLHAAQAIEEYWEEHQSYKDIENQPGVDVDSSTISRVWRDFFGPADEDLTFWELGEKYEDPTDEDEGPEEALNEYLRARKHDRLDEFKQTRGTIQRQESDEDVATPLNARELEIARRYYEEGVSDLMGALDLSEEDLPAEFQSP